MCDYSPLFLHRADECWWVCVTASSFDRRQWTSFGCSTSWQVCYSVYYTADHFCGRFRLSMRMVQCVANTMRVRLPWSVRDDRLIPVGACMYVLDSALVSKYSQISPFFFSRFFSSVVDCLKIIERVATTCDKVGAIICEGKRGDFHSLAEGCRSESSANFEHSVPWILYKTFINPESSVFPSLHRIHIYWYVLSDVNVL